MLHVRTQTLSNRSAPFIRQTILGLRPYLHNVVLTPSTDCANPDDLPIELVQVRDFTNPLACLALGMRLRKKYPFVSLVMGHMGNGTRCARKLAAVLGVPMLGVFGGSDVNVELPKDLYRHAYAELLADPSSHFLTVAGYLRDKLIEVGAPPERVFVWHRGTNLAEFIQIARPPTAERPVRLIISARFYEVKGHEYALRAIAKLRSEGRSVELVLLGDGPLKDQMHGLAAELGITDQVQFVGQVAHDEVKRHLHAADVYLHPSVSCAEGRVEGVPNAIMEAHATGLPVVATRHGGIEEVVVDGQTGFLVDERDADQLADRIGRLVDNRELRLEMGRRGRAHIEQEFNLELQARRLAARILHTIKAGELYDLRGWPLHRAETGETSQEPRSLADVRSDDAPLVDRLANARFKTKLKVLGPIYSAYRNAMWTVVFRPFSRFLANELSAYMSSEMSAKLATVIGGLNTGGVAAPRHGHTGRELDTQLLMSDAACPDCPHARTQAPWPDRPCPLDAACMRALQREFVHVPPLRPVPTRARDGELVVDDADVVDGRMPYPNGVFDRVHYRGDLQKVGDVRGFLRELRRVLKPEGEVQLEIWPMPFGRDGGRLLGNVAVPFAQLLFLPDVIEEFVGTALRPPRQFDHVDVERWANDAGLLVSHRTARPAHQDPCEMHVQARFAPVFRKLGWSPAKLAVSFSARLEAGGAAFFEESADHSADTSR